MHIGVISIFGDIYIIPPTKPGSAAACPLHCGYEGGNLVSEQDNVKGFNDPETSQIAGLRWLAFDFLHYADGLDIRSAFVDFQALVSIDHAVPLVL